MALSTHAVMDLVQNSPHVNLDNMVLYTMSSFETAASQLPELLCSRSDITKLTIKCGLVEWSLVLAILDAASQMTNLSCLSLEKDTITQDWRWGEIPLRTNFQFARALKSLALVELPINDIKTIQFLSDVVKQSTTLTSLTCTHNGLGPDQAYYLAVALMGNTSITYLDLSSNPLGNVGVSWVAWALADNKQLETLNLRATCMRQWGMSDLAWYLPSCTNLTALDVSVNGIGDEGLKSIRQAASKMKRLSHLYIADLVPGPWSGQHLETMLTEVTGLLKLDCADNRFMSAKHVSNGLRGNSTLIDLDLGGNTFEHGPCEGISELATVLAAHGTLTRLNLEGGFIRPMDARMIIQGNAQLLSLDLSNNFLGSSIFTRTIAEAMSHGNCLMELELTGNNIGDEDCEHLLAAIAFSTSLRSLFLRCNRLSGAHFERLAITTLRVLDVSYNPFNQAGLSNQITGGTGCKTLNELHLEGCQLYTMPIDCISKLLEPCMGIAYLDLSNNFLGDEFANRVAQTLAGDNMLIQIDLRNNDLSPKAGMYGILQALRSNTTLQRIDLDGNDGVRARGVIGQINAQIRRNRSTLVRYVTLSQPTTPLQLNCIQADVGTLGGDVICTQLYAQNEELKTLVSDIRMLPSSHGMNVQIYLAGGDDCLAKEPHTPLLGLLAGATM